MSRGNHSLSPEFWEQFRSRHWDRTPTVLRQPLASPFMTSEEAFEAVLHACDAARAGDMRAPVKLVVDDFLWTGGPATELLPNGGDSSAEAYAARMEERLEGRKFALVANSLQAHDARLWLRLREFLHPLSAVIPAHSTNVCLFLGNYERTPYGIHRDPASIFMFVAHGRKRMRAWSAECFSDESGRAQSVEGISPGEGTLLEGEAGDVLFWPSTYWHVGEGLGELSVALSLGVTPARPAVDAWSMLMGRVEEQVADSINQQWAGCTLADLPNSPDPTEQLAERMRKALDSAVADPELASTMRIDWLKRRTALGCHQVPPPLPRRALADEEELRADPAYPIVWGELPDHEMALSACGHTFRLPADPRVQELVRFLNSGVPATVEHLIDEFTGTTEREAVRFNASAAGIRTILGWLVSTRGLEILPAPAPHRHRESIRVKVTPGNQPVLAGSR